MGSGTPLIVKKTSTSSRNQTRTVSMVGQDLTHSATWAPMNMIKKIGALQNIKIFRQTKQNSENGKKKYINLTKVHIQECSKQNKIIINQEKINIIQPFFQCFVQRLCPLYLNSCLTQLIKDIIQTELRQKRAPTESQVSST